MMDRNYDAVEDEENANRLALADAVNAAHVRSTLSSMAAGNDFPGSMLAQHASLSRAASYGAGLLGGTNIASNDNSGLSLRNIEAATMMKRQQEEQMIATRFLMQQQQQDQALFAAAAAASSGNPMLGNHTHPLLGNTAATRSGLEQAQAFLQHQQNLLRPQRMLPTAGHAFGGGIGGFLQQQQQQHQQQQRQMDVAADNLSKLGDLKQSPFSPSRTHKQGSAQAQPYYDASQMPEPTSDEEDDDDDDPDDDELDDDGNKKDKKPKGGIIEPFPQKLYRMIEEAEKAGQSDIVSFFPHGRAFAIHKPRKFIAEMMPKFFSTSRMSSFQRQLNLYGFRRITEGRDKGGYFHEFFLQGRKGLCKKIKRKKAAAPKNMDLAIAVHANNAMGAGILNGFNTQMMMPFRNDPSQFLAMQQILQGSGIGGSGPAGGGFTGNGLSAGGFGSGGMGSMGAEGSLLDAARLGALGSTFDPTNSLIMGNNASLRNSFLGNDLSNLNAATAALYEQKKADLLAQLHQQQHQQDRGGGGNPFGSMRGNQPPF